MRLRDIRYGTINGHVCEEEYKQKCNTFLEHTIIKKNYK